ncbi:ditrans,polycis-polyprenyl diphosphate synthase, partial [Cymbomonas tetramitiformis]
CELCSAEYVRDFEMSTVGFKRTKRRCSKRDCEGHLRDQVLDWEDALPKQELQSAERNCREAGLSLCLGTSLLITPSCELPVKTVKAGGAMAIVNLQKTNKDKRAKLVIHARVDEVMAAVMEALNTTVPRYLRTDFLHIDHAPGTSTSRGIGFTLVLCSVHGKTCAVPWIESVEISFPEDASLKSASATKLPMQVRMLHSSRVQGVVVAAPGSGRFVLWTCPTGQSDEGGPDPQHVRDAESARSSGEGDVKSD